MTFQRQLQRLNDATAHQPEIPGVDGYRDVCEAAHDAVECSRGHELEGSFPLAGASDGVDHVVALAPTFEEGLDQLGWILQVAVHQHDRIAPRYVEAGRRCNLVPKVPGEVDDNDFMVGQGQVSKPYQRPVARAVVHQHELVTRRVAQPGDDGSNPPHQFIDVPLLVVEWDDDRKQLGR